MNRDEITQLAILLELRRMRQLLEATPPSQAYKDLLVRAKEEFDPEELGIDPEELFDA